MVSDPIADMLVQIKNAGQVKKDTVTLPYSQFKQAIAESLQEAGYINGVETAGSKANKELVIELAYTDDGDLRITGVERMSKPSRRLYYSVDEIPQIKYGYGDLILSTPKGILTDEAAKEARVGGEALFKIW